MRLLILILTYLAALYAMRRPELRSMLDGLGLPPRVEAEWIPLALYTLVVYGIASGRTVAKVRLDLSRITDSQARQLHTALRTLDVVETAPALAKLQQVERLMGVADQVSAKSKSAIEVVEKLNARLRRLSQVDVVDAKAILSVVATLRTLEGIDVSDLDISEQVDAIKEQVKLVEELASDNDLDEVKDHIDALVEVAQKLAKMAEAARTAR